MKIALLVWLAVMASGVPALAQEQELVPASASQQKFDELAKWLRQYHEWEKWFELWGNKVAHNSEDLMILHRKERPEPPVWLEAECQGQLGTDGVLESACDILSHWDEQPLLILQRRRSSLTTSGGKPDDKVVKSSFFRRVHLTGLWTQAQYPATPVYGIVGMQVAVIETGRFTLPAIGVMLVLIPDGAGGHAWTPATTVGFGYRICDFVPPLMKKRASLHVNLARVNLHGGQDQPILQGALTRNLFGLSLSPTRHR